MSGLQFTQDEWEAVESDAYGPEVQANGEDIAWIVSGNPADLYLIAARHHQARREAGFSFSAFPPAPSHSKQAICSNRRPKRYPAVTADVPFIIKRLREKRPG